MPQQNAAHPNVPERAVIERMKLAYRRDVCASDVVGAPPFTGCGEDRLGKGVDDNRSPAGGGLQSVQAGVAEVMGRLRTSRLGVADHVLSYALLLVRPQTPVINPIVETHRAFGCLDFKMQSDIADLQGHRNFPSMAPASDQKWANDVDHSNEYFRSH
jgi:hypothetical protein